MQSTQDVNYTLNPPNDKLVGNKTPPNSLKAKRNTCTGSGNINGLVN